MAGPASGGGVIAGRGATGSQWDDVVHVNGHALTAGIAELAPRDLSALELAQALPGGAVAALGRGATHGSAFGLSLARAVRTA